MREIKFDLAVKNKNTGYINHKYYFLSELMIGVKNLFDVENYDVLSKRQYTGLKDKNGKEIYESDVIHCIGDTFPAVVIFDEKALCWAAQLYHNGVKNELMTLGRYIHSRERAVRTRIEVIGNIYENPELLDE